MSSIYYAQNERIGRRIRAARRQAGLSHDALGARVGTSRQHLIRLEKGKHRPGQPMLRKIAEATGKTVDYFVSDDEDDEESDPMLVLMSAIKRYVRAEMHA